MIDPPAIEELLTYLQSGSWKTSFSEGVITAGHRSSRAKQVFSTKAEVLDTGDIEIIAQVSGNSPAPEQTTLALWKENSQWLLDASCSCPVDICCVHAAATLEHLTRPGRLNTAFGGESSSKTTQKNTLKSLPSKSLITPPPVEDICFHLDIRRRPDDPRVAWLPEIYATAHVSYQDKKFTLDPAGRTNPPCDRPAETTALNSLYALGLLPGAEQAPPSLKKQPAIKEILWAPDSKEWQPSIYWQRFHHEAITALEKRGWKVTRSNKVGHQPLSFNASSWRAEIIDEGKGWFSLSAGFEIEGTKLELQPILATLVEYQFLERTKDFADEDTFLIFLPDGVHAGKGLTLPVGRFRKILSHLGELMDFQFSQQPIALHQVEAAALAESLSGEDVSFEAPEALLDFSKKIKNFPELAAPKGLKATLRSYQLEGYQWMQFLASQQLNGILADDMGLGKTMQSLAHILAEKEKGNRLPNLIIAPTSVVENWQREAEKFAPELKVVILQGHSRHRRFSELNQCDIVMSSYALLHRDLEHYKKQAFHLFILDEAQHIKNPSAQVSHAVRQINSKHRICLSGTPIENHLGELWSLFDFLMPKMLGDEASFRETFRTPIEINGNKSRADALATKVGPLILRRTKDEVATELPPKTIIPHFIELDPGAIDLYETVRSTMDKHVREAMAMQGQKAQIVFLDALLKLRQICCHPTLVQSDQYPSSPNSSKFDYLVELLDTLKKENRRVLLFSQFTSMLDIIEDHLINSEFTYLKLTGSTKNRHELVDRFQQAKTDVFLISLKAGGTGLTLTAADTVIHYDPWWNPAAENQATDRAYRIGQDKAVFVHKLICRGTVEERIQQMQDKKNDIAQSILTASLNQLQLNDEVLTKLLAPIEPS